VELFFAKFKSLVSNPHKTTTKIDLSSMLMLTLLPIGNPKKMPNLEGLVSYSFKCDILAFDFVLELPLPCNMVILPSLMHAIK
jgi:hypothetical protein